MSIMNNRIFNRTAILIMILSIMFAVVLPGTSFAAGATVSLSSDKALYKPGEEITVGITISAQEQIGTYYIQMEYDTERMIYMGGADSENEGVLVLTGTGLEDTISYELHFEAAASGSGGIYISKAVINSALEGKKLTPSYDPVFEILMSGNSSLDTFETMVENGKFISLTGLPVIGSIRDQNEDILYILDHFQMVPEAVAWDYSLTGGVFEGTELAYITDQQGNIRILCMTDVENNYHMFAVGPDGKLYPVIKHTDKSGNIFYISSVNAASGIPGNISRNDDVAKYAVYSIDQSGNGKTAYIDHDGNIKEIGEELIQPWMYLAVIIIILFAGIVVLFWCMNRSKGKKKNYTEDDPAYVKETTENISDSSPESGEVFMKMEQRPYSHEEIFERTSKQGHKYIYVADVADEEPETSDSKEIIPRKKIEAIMADDID